MGGLARHGTAPSGTVPAATLRGTQPRILPAGACTGSGIGAPGLGVFLVVVPVACPRFPPRNGEPRAMGCSPLWFSPSGALRRETEAHRNLGSFQATSQGQSLILPFRLAAESTLQPRGEEGTGCSRGGVQHCKRSRGSNSSVDVLQDTVYLPAGRSGTGRHCAPGMLRTEHPLPAQPWVLWAAPGTAGLGIRRAN